MGKTPALALALLLPGTLQALEPAMLDGHIDLYGTNLDGASATLHLEEHSLLGGSSMADADPDAGASPEVGVRALLGAADRPWLVGVDLSAFDTGNPQFAVDVLQIGVVGGIRAPRPLFARHGRGLRPYLLVGISSAAIDGHAEAGGIRAPVNASSGFLTSGASTTVPVFAAGLEWRFSPHLGLVAEYRRREYDIEGLGTDSWILPSVNTTVDGTLDASGLLLGISWWLDAPAGAARMSPPAPPATDTPATAP